MNPEDRSLRAIYTELVSNPFFPLLFISEAIKVFVEILANGNPITDPLLIGHMLLAFGATVLWVFSDAVDISVDTDKIVGD